MATKPINLVIAYAGPTPPDQQNSPLTGLFVHQRKMVMPADRLIRSLQLKQFSNLAIKVKAQRLDDLKVNAGCCLVIQPRDGAPVDAGIPRHVYQFQLFRPHQGR